MAELNKNKYLDLTGLQAFWNRVKDVILHSIVIVREGVAGDNDKGEAQDNTYIKIYTDNSNQTEDGGQQFIYTVDDSLLVEKLDDVDESIVTEETSRKKDIALLAGTNWDASSHAWSSAPEYQDITEISERLVAHDDQISALVTATEFVGVVDWDPEKAIIATIDDDENPQTIQMFDVKVNNVSKGKFRSGDIIIYGTKEYILDGDVVNNYENPSFVELGDVSEELIRLEAIEDWIKTPIDENDLNNVFKGIVTDQNEK